jgi:ferredoxin
MKVMKVAVNQATCDTSGVCVQELPELFRFQPGSKKAIARQAEVPARLQERCREVARRCPTGAILVVEGEPEAGSAGP